MANILKRDGKHEKETVRTEGGAALRGTRMGRRDLLRAGLLAGAGLAVTRMASGASTQTSAGSGGRTARNTLPTPFLQAGAGTQVINRARLGNNTEDLCYYTSFNGTSKLAIMDGYDVIDSTLRTKTYDMKLFDVLGLPVKAAPRGITFAARRNLFVFSDTLQPAALFLTDTLGYLRQQLDIQYLNSETPQSVEGLTYIPPTFPKDPEYLVLVAAFSGANGIESRLEIINFYGQVVREIIPQKDLSTLFLTGVCFKPPSSLLVSSNDDNLVYELDFVGDVIQVYDGSIQITGPPLLHGIEGLAVSPNGIISAASGFDGFIANFSKPGKPVTQGADYRVGPGLSLPSGIAWDSTEDVFLLLALNRELEGEPAISAIKPSFGGAGTIAQVDSLTRKITYLPDEQLIAATHTNNPRGILLFDRQGQTVGQISTSQFGIPQVISYIPATREFVLVFRDTQDPGKSRKLFLLTRTGALSRIIDLTQAGASKITAATFFNPDDPTGGQFLVMDGNTGAAFVTDFTGATLRQFSVRDELGILAPTAVTAITTGYDAGSFAVTNGETSEIVVFRLN
jgi:hypothetical protein